MRQLMMATTVRLGRGRELPALKCTVPAVEAVLSMAVIGSSLPSFKTRLPNSDLPSNCHQIILFCRRSQFLLYSMGQMPSKICQTLKSRKIILNVVYFATSYS